MADIFMPKKKADSSQRLLTAGGAISGAIVGGPAGAAMGASLGSTASGLLAKNTPQAQPVETAMTRRMAQIDNSPLSQIRDSIDSLQYVQDPALKQQLAAPLVQASIMAKRNPGV